MNILGISAYYHDSAACLVVDGKIISAAQEERFTRKKHDESFPVNAIKYCLSEAKLSADKINYVVFYDKPFLKFERLFETYLAFAPKGFNSFSASLPVWAKDKIFQKSLIINSLTISAVPSDEPSSITKICNNGNLNFIPAMRLLIFNASLKVGIRSKEFAESFTCSL